MKRFQKLCLPFLLTCWILFCSSPAIAISVFIHGFSGGGDDSGTLIMKNDFEAKGITHGPAEWRTWRYVQDIVDIIVARKQTHPNEPVILVGHSFGADTAVEVAQALAKSDPKIRIDLLIQIDTVGINDDEKPSNVTLICVFNKIIPPGIDIPPTIRSFTI